MNPLHRKMFRQPGMSRQPMGILASSPQLANVVRQRMGQPVQMAHGGYHPPRSPMGRVSTSRRPVPGSVRIPLIDLLPMSGFARPALDRFMAAAGDDIPSTGIGAIRGKVQQDALTDLAMQSIRRGGSPFSSAVTGGPRPDVVERGQRLSEIASADRTAQPVLGDVDPGLLAALTPAEPMSDAERMAANRANLAALRSAQGLGQGANVSIPTGGGIADTDVADDTRRNANIDALRNLRTAVAVRQGRDTALDPTLDPTLEFATSVGMLQDDPELGNRPPAALGQAGQPTAGEELAASSRIFTDPDEIFPDTTAPPTDGTPRKVSTTDPDEKQPAEQAAENLMGTDQDAQFMQDPMSVVDMVRNAQDNPENKTAKQKADATDSILNIKNLKERKALLKNLLGEEKAKDIRTDAGYNLMMTGLLIAAGQSEDAMTNIAKGLLGGLQGFGTAVGEEAQAQRKLDRELSMLAYSELSDEQKAARAAQVAEDARIKERAFQASETDKKLAFQKAENALSRISQAELKEMGFENALKIAELGVESREKIAELNRKNQMAIAELPSGEIRGLLQIYGNDNEKVQEYLEAKNKLKSKDTDTDDLTASLTRIIEGEGTAADTARLLASPAGQKAIQNAGNITDAASELLETTTENKDKRGDRNNKPNDGFSEVTITN